MAILIYLDNAATTKPYPEAVEAMNHCLTDLYGNPGAIYSFGLQCENAIFNARLQVANFMGCGSGHVIFTAGGTEANNLALLGVANRLKRVARTRVLVSEVEHDSVIHTAEAMEDMGFFIEYIPVQSDGTVSCEVLKEMLDTDVGLVSVMTVNNEIGSVNPTQDLAIISHEYGALFHTDCVQATTSTVLDVVDRGFDFVSISSHKIHGPKGVGALYVDDLSLVEPIIHGGHNQEFGIRGGTENVPGIVGFGKACSMTQPFDASQIKILFMDRLKELTPTQHYTINGAPLNSSSHILSLTIHSIDAESLVMNVGRNGVAISTGSACRSKLNDESRVLKAIGLSHNEIKSTIRVSFSSTTTEEDAAEGAKIIADYINKRNDVDMD